MMSVTKKQLEPRTERAATESMVVARKSPIEYEVYSTNAENDRYLVNSVTKECTCKDWEYREPDGGCKHWRRLALTRGDIPVPDVDGIDRVLLKQRERGL